jgi:hypothetical protein
MPNLVLLGQSQFPPNEINAENSKNHRDTSVIRILWIVDASDFEIDSFSIKCPIVPVIRNSYTKIKMWKFLKM